MGTHEQEKTSGTASFAADAQELGVKSELTMAETERLLPPAVDFIAQAGWDQVPKMLAIALAVHQVVDEQATRVHQLARALLRRKSQKETAE